MRHLSENTGPGDPVITASLMDYTFHAPNETYKTYPPRATKSTRKFYGFDRKKERSMAIHPKKKYFVCPASTIKGNVFTIFYTRKDSGVNLTITEWSPRLLK